MSATKPKSHRKELTGKQLAFVKQYVKTNGNGTKAALASYNTDDQITAKAIASENLTKPYILTEIHKQFQRVGLSIDDVLSVHKRNLMQDTNLKVSQTAVGDYYKVTKMIGSEGKDASNVNIAIVIED